MGIVMDRHKGEIARGALLGTLFEASELSALTAHQTAILLASQGGKYAPFISGEVNRAIGNQIAALKPKIDLLKVLFDGKSGTLGLTNPAVPVAAQMGTKQGTVLTIEMAHNMLLEGHQSVMTNPALLGPITDADSTLQVLPETNPNMQGGNILSSKSLYKGSDEDLQSLANGADHTEKNRANKGHIEVEDEDEFRA